LWLHLLAATFSYERSTSAPESEMKLIIAIIQPSKLEAVKAALTEVEVFRLTVMDCQGFGRQKGQTEIYRGREFTVNLLRKVQLQIAVNEEFVEPTIRAIIQGGRTGEKGEIGDGKIFVLPLEDCIRIRTGERGKEAI
jgi:nitrogen regulatory protein P-II 1